MSGERKDNGRGRKGAAKPSARRTRPAAGAGPKAFSPRAATPVHSNGPAAAATPLAKPIGDHPAPAEATATDRLAENAAKIVEAGRKVAESLSGRPEGPHGQDVIADSIADAVRTLGRAGEYWLGHPERLVEAQTEFAGRMIDLWSNTLQRFTGETTEPLIPREKSDKRFAAPEWDQPFFDFLRQAHAISADWAKDCLDRSEGLDPRTKAKAAFYLRQIASASSPSNFLLTNPELLKATLQSDGENLVDGLAHLAEDIQAGHGQLRLRQSDSAKLELGRDMAATPGKVVFRNDLIDLLQ